MAPEDTGTPKDGKSRPPGRVRPARPRLGVTRPAAPASPRPAEPAEPTQPGGGDETDPLVWIDSPDQASVQAFQKYECPPAGEAALVEDDPDQPLVTCDDEGVKYLLSPALIEGTDLQSAEAAVPQQQVDWVVTLDFDGDGTQTFTEISRSLYNTGKQFAIVLDGQVISAPTMDGVITNGRAEISGDFTEQTATSLATSLKYGALPIAFQPNPPVETVGPSLAGNQLVRRACSRAPSGCCW